MNHAFLFVGLGNPGPRYVGTRHNLGADVLRTWADEKAADFPTIDMLWPDAGMNNSGVVVAEYMRQHGFTASQLVILHDDIELSLGEVRSVSGGSAKGHRGVRSVHEALGTTDIPRIRLGIGRPPTGMEVNQFVLERFGEAEKEAVAALKKQALELLLVVAQNN